MKTPVKLLALPFLATALVAACDRPGLETRTFRLDHLAAQEAMSLIEPYVFDERPGWPGAMSRIRGAVTVRETKDNLGRIARVLDEFDVPQEDVRLRFQLIEANGERGTDAAIADVVAELREVFRFEGYRLLGETVVSTALSGEFEQYLSGTSELWRIEGSVYRPAAEGIRLQDVTLQGDYGTPIRTSATVRMGQTLVLGSGARMDREQPSNRLGMRDGAVILVVRVEPAG